MPEIARINKWGESCLFAVWAGRLLVDDAGEALESLVKDRKWRGDDERRAAGEGRRASRELLNA